MHKPQGHQPEDKAKFSLNSVKTGLTGHLILLPTEDAAFYEAHVESFQAEFQAVGERERTLVLSLSQQLHPLLHVLFNGPLITLFGQQAGDYRYRVRAST